MWWELIAAVVVTPLVAMLADRFKYARDIARHGDKLVKAMPDGDLRRIAEQAVLAANQYEVERQVQLQQRRRLEHEVRMAAIRAGARNVGDR